ncbi:MAG: adenylate/guanylate cyclase domain-containing protein [Verrucomicrobiota bacterium]
MFIAQGSGSLFNIPYNLIHLSPLLSDNQADQLAKGIQYYNLAAYPPLVLLWAVCVFRLRQRTSTAQAFQRQQKRVVHLPLHAALIAAAGWILCLPSLLMALHQSEDPLNPHVSFHLSVSLGVAMTIAVTIGFFLIDALSRRLLFPFFFQESSPAQLKGTFRLSLSARSRLTTIAASICPIILLLLLLISPEESSRNLTFVLAVTGGGILCAVLGSSLFGRFVHRPVEELRAASERVGRGDLETEVSNLRADEFGILADSFNEMVAGLREKERVKSTFGRHVGQEIARQLLENEEELSGVERRLSVLFADIRGFTTRCEALPPRRAVEFLNLYHTHTTAVIEESGGIVNQLIGDGIMALFGATGKEPASRHDGSNAAIEGGIEMLRSLKTLNATLTEHDFEPVRIGIGIHTGAAVVGTIGSSRRTEYTAIGDTVNTAARIEALTKEAGAPLLISEATWKAADPKPDADRLPPCSIRGREQEITLYSVSLTEAEDQ